MSNIHDDEDIPPFEVGDIIEFSGSKNILSYHNYVKINKKYRVKIMEFSHGEWILVVEKDPGPERYYSRNFKLVKSAINCTLCNDTGNSGFMYVIRCSCGQ